jgi:hypothetical protein
LISEQMMASALQGGVPSTASIYDMNSRATCVAEPDLLGDYMQARMYHSAEQARSDEAVPVWFNGTPHIVNPVLFQAAVEGRGQNTSAGLADRWLGADLPPMASWGATMAPRVEHFAPTTFECKPHGVEREYALPEQTRQLALPETTYIAAPQNEYDVMRAEAAAKLRRMQLAVVQRKIAAFSQL